MAHILSFQLNGVPVQTLVKSTDSLLDVLREKMDVTSPKRGCESGDCGACTILLEGRSVRACLTLALTVEGKQVLTVESLAQDGPLQPLQEAFVAHGASQCGYCTSGMLISATALLKKNPHPQRQEIASEMAGNLCRCGCYEEITQAILATAEKGD